MRQKILRMIAAAAFAMALAIPASAAELLIPVGRVVGLSVEEGTVTVMGFDETLGIEAREKGILVGDEILTADGETVDSAADLRQALAGSDGSVELELRRGSETIRKTLSPSITDRGPMLGLYLREGITGIGTVTYFDPDSGEFGALGHGVSSSSGQICDMESGEVYAARVVGVRKGEPGAPGQLRGFVPPAEPLAQLRKNTPCGIVGTGGLWQGEALPAAQPGEVTEGQAKILSNIDGEAVREFSVEILRIGDSGGRDLLLEVTDPALIEATGGIVAGMSGSPILQNGRLIGAVTHVLVNDPTRGYGILIQNMRSAAE